jgi:hypothetical protein
MTYWKKYNDGLLGFAKRLADHNTKNHFNYIEETIYPHIRDILALTISLIQSNTDIRPISILDYGSNLTVWSNFVHKIDTSFLDISIYDPFSDQNSLSPLNLPYQKLEISSDLGNLKKQKYSLVVFGSIAQYDHGFIENWKSQCDFQTDYILFTHTPLSKDVTFASKQFSDFQGTQWLHSRTELVQLMKAIGFELIFQSMLDPKKACVEPDLEDRTLLANLLFKKQ